MAQPAQVIFGTPNNDFNVIDNAAAPSFPSPNASSLLGYDTTPGGGAVAQGKNSFGDTGTVLLDTVNDTVYADPSVATVVGNPVLNTQPTYAVVTKVLQDSRQGINILFKNPA